MFEMRYSYGYNSSIPVPALLDIHIYVAVRLSGESCKEKQEDVTLDDKCLYLTHFSGYRTSENIAYCGIMINMQFCVI